MAKFSKKQQTLIEDALCNWREREISKIKEQHTIPEKSADITSLMDLHNKHGVTPDKTSLSSYRYNEYVEVTLYYSKKDAENIENLFQKPCLSDEGKKAVEEITKQYEYYEKVIFLGDEQEALAILRELE